MKYLTFALTKGRLASKTLEMLEKLGPEFEILREVPLEDIRAKLNVFSAKHVAFLREFCRGTQEVEMDGNGRVLLPKRILADVGIDKEMVFAAQDKSIQIWDADTYARVAMEPGKLSALAEEIFKG